MSKSIANSDRDAILRAVGQFPSGATTDEIAGRISGEVPRRTLQYRVAALANDGRLIVSGRGRATRYYLPVIEDNAPIPVVREDEPEPYRESYIPVSPDGEAIKRYVRREKHERRPLGYRREFLDGYLPNKTFYLPAEVRQRLANLGRLSEKKVLPAGSYARRVYQRLIIDLPYGSSHLEGNTYSLLETKRLIELGEHAQGKQLKDAVMILNHKQAIDLMVDSAAEIGFDRRTICTLHALLSRGLMDDPDASGRLRTIPVFIGGSVYEPLDVPQFIEECFDQMLWQASEIEDPFEQAFFALVHFPYLQPFEDVNKRVARLAANIPFLKKNFCPLSFVDVPTRAFVDGVLGVYEMNQVELLRDFFVYAYEQSCDRYADVRQRMGEPDPFKFKHRGLIDELVADVVRQKMDRKSAAAFLRESSTRVPEPERDRLIEILHRELEALHEYSAAIYRLRPAEFTEWAKVWR